MKRSNTPLIERGGLLGRILGRTVCWPALALALATPAVVDAAPPELKTQGNLIVEKATSAPVRLAGVNIPSLEWGNGENIMTSLEVAVRSWKANVIRLPVKRNLWNGSNQAAYRATVDAFIARASELNAYVILDLHEYTKALYADATFWSNAADRYKNNPAVLFGLLNEPHGGTWAAWRNGDGSTGPGIQGLLNAVRATGANNIVLAGGLEYAYFVTAIVEGGHELTDTSTGNGVVYDTHIYPWKSYIQSNVGTAAQTVPVFIGELGHPGGTIMNPHDPFEAETTWVPKWMDWVNAHNLHWTGWSFYVGADPRMLADWSYTPSSNWGVAAKRHLQSYADPEALRVVGGTVIGTPDNDGVVTDWRNGAVAAFDGSYDTYFTAPTASGSWTGLDLVTPRRITQIKYMPRASYGGRMVNGVFHGSNSPTFTSAVTLHTVTTAPVATGGVYTTVPVTDTGTYRYVRYVGPDGSYCNVASIMFYTGTRATPVVSEDVIVIDNGGAGCTITGSWNNSDVGGFHGTSSVSDGNAGKGTKSMRYTPTITDAGLYTVYARWSQHSSRATNAPYDITHADGVTTIYVDQRSNGAMWYPLGDYYFDAGTSGNVLLRTDGTTSYVSADGVMFERVPDTSGPVEIIMDNTDTSGVTITGSWTTSTGVSGYYGSNFIHDTNGGKGTKSVRYTPTITVPGAYEVYARWTAHSSRSTAVPIDVTHSGGTTTHTVNQQNNGGEWRLLGTYTFAAGTSGNVLVHNTGTSGHVVADAVRFYKPGAAAATEVIVDAGDPADSARVTITGSWVTSTSTAGYYGADYIHDNDTGHGTKSVKFTPDLPVAGTYDVYLIWTSGSSRASNVPVSIVHAGGTATTTVNQRTYGGQWRYVGTYTFNAGTGGSVTLSNTGTNGYVIADAVLFDPH